MYCWSFSIAVILWLVICCGHHNDSMFLMKQVCLQTWVSSHVYQFETCMVKVAMYIVLYMCKAICSLHSFCRIAYAVWLLMKIASQQPKDIKVSVMHDAACTLVTGTLSRCIYILCDTVLYLSSRRRRETSRNDFCCACLPTLCPQSILWGEHYDCL